MIFANMRGDERLLRGTWGCGEVLHQRVLHPQCRLKSIDYGDMRQ